MFVSNSGLLNAFVLSLMVIVIPEFAFAQIRQKSQIRPFSPIYSKLTFNQDLNIYDWFYTFNFQKLLNHRLEFKIKEEFRSTLQSISSKDLWKDNQNFTFSLAYPIMKHLFLNTEFYSHILRDPLAGFDNDVTFHSGTASFVYQPNQNIAFSPQISSKWQTQVEQSDQGLGIGIDARINNVEFGGYKSDITVLGTKDFFPQRRNEDVKIRYSIERQFYSSTADTLTVIFDRLRRDTFDRLRMDNVSAETYAIFVRNLTQTNRGFENRLSYRLYPSMTLYLKNAIVATSFRVNNIMDDETQVREKDDRGFESKHSINLTMRKPRWFGNIGWNFRAHSRDSRRRSFNTRHPSLGFDTDELFVNLALRGGLSLSKTDSIGIYAAVSKFQYETSDTINPNDHDQLRWQFTLSHAHNFGSNLKLIWRGSTFLNHFVYISSKFSSGNNWERVFQLTPIIVYQPSEHFTFRQSFTVRAKYQTYDFDDAETSNRNLVNRQFILTNSSKFALTPKSWVELGINLELAEQGKLFYDLWRQRLAMSWRNHEIQFLYRQRIGSNFVLAPGGNVFYQIRWTHKPNSEGVSEKSVKDTHTNLGPLLEISYRPSKSLEFVFLGNVQVVYAARRETEYINNFDVNLNWFF